MKPNKTILHVVTKNTSTLDFTIPYFKSISGNKKNVRIVIFIYTLDKKEYFRKKVWYEKQLEGIKAEIYDLSDFVNKNIKPILSFIEKSTIKTSKHDFIGCLRGGVLKGFKIISKSILNRVVYYIANEIIKPEDIISLTKPDVVFYDVRRGGEGRLSEKLKLRLYEKNIKIMCIPHAPHMRAPKDEFVPFSEKLREQDKIEYAIPMINSHPWNYNKVEKRYFIETGYPGLDKKFINQLVIENEKNKNRKRKKALVVLRNYVKSSNRDGVDSFVLREADVDIIIKNIIKVLLDNEIEVVIKPHPSTSINKIESLVSDSEKKSTSISVSYESIYSLIGCVDYAICFPSTVSVITASANIPTAIVNIPLQNEIEESWIEYQRLYNEPCYQKIEINNISCDLKLLFNNTEFKSLDVEKYFYTDPINRMEKYCFE